MFPFSVAGSRPRRKATLQRQYSARQKITLMEFPEELRESIFVFVKDPSRLVKTNRGWREVGKKSIVRVRWLTMRFGIRDAFQGSLRWTKVLDSETLDVLLQIVPTIPRYIIQRAFTRFQHINKPSLLVPLLQHGLILYDDLALHKNDGQQFKELLPYASQNQHNHMTFIMQARLEALDDLVNTYGFDVNFCKWSNVTGLPLLHTNEGFRTFLTAVSSGNETIVKALLKYNIATYIERYPNPTHMVLTRPFDFIFPLFEATPQWEDSFFPADVRMYMANTVEALLLATKNKRTEIMQLLLEHDVDRWSTDAGFETLKLIQQLAVDENYPAGVELLSNYMRNHTPPGKSPMALKRALVTACLENDLKAVKDLLAEGARFDVGNGDGVTTTTQDPLKHLIASEYEEIFKHLIKTLDFTPEKLSDLLAYAIDHHAYSIARHLLTNRYQKALVTDRHLRRCIVHNANSLMPCLLRALLSQQPDKLVGGLPAVLRMAQRRAKDGEGFVAELESYKEKVLKNVMKSKDNGTKKGKNKGKGKGKKSGNSNRIRASDVGLGIASGSGVTKPKMRMTNNSRRAAEGAS